MADRRALVVVGGSTQEMAGTDDLLLNRDPSSLLHAATKQYTDNKFAPKLAVTTTKTANYTAVGGDIVACNAAGGAFTVTLPAAVVGSTPITVVKSDASANAITVAGTGGDTFGIISPTSTVTIMLSGQAVMFVPISGGWVPVAGFNPLSALDGRYTRLPDVQSYASSSGTWAKPLVVTSFALLIAMAPGSGGGSGRRGATSTVACGGGGGAGGGYLVAIIPTSALNATEAYSIGASGNGGVGVLVDSTNGNVGQTGGSVTFGVRGSDFLFSTRAAVLGGSGGTASSGAGGSVVNAGGQVGGAGGAASGTGGTGGGGLSSAGGAGGGGAGGGVSSANVPAAGGAAGIALSTQVAAANPGGGTSGNSGSAGISLQTGAARPGSGGSGGGGGLTGPGGAGGVGGDYGGGGGGGGASRDTFNSGAGGNGGAGYLVVITV